jgi:hypothetical protein
MANATAKVKKAYTDTLGAEQQKRSSITLGAETTYYSGAMVGMTSAGYLDKFDDSEGMVFVGIVRDNQVLPAGTAADGTIDLQILKPAYIELAISSVAVTDIGKPVYAVDDQTGTLDPSTRTYANVVGSVEDVKSSGIAIVRCAYDGVAANARLMAAKVMAATGTQTLSKFDVGKLILLPNTAAHTLNLPPVADCPAGAVLEFAKTSSDAAAVTLDGNSSENIDGSTTLATVGAIYDTVRLRSIGSAWVVMARDIT